VIDDTNQAAEPKEDLRRVHESQIRFNLAIENLDDAAMRRASLLPGWSVGHVLSHVSRNAESHVRRTEAAADSLIVEQYVGGYAGRAEEIDNGAGRSARDQIEDVRHTAELLERTWSTLEPTAWNNPVIDVAQRERPLRLMPGRRWQELEVHFIDLGIGVTCADWPEDFVSDRLPVLRETLQQRLPEGTVAPGPGSLAPSEELCWLFGRLSRKDLPQLAPWD